MRVMDLHKSSQPKLDLSPDKKQRRIAADRSELWQMACHHDLNKKDKLNNALELL